jgi:hypothetical protein
VDVFEFSTYQTVSIVLTLLALSALLMLGAAVRDVANSLRQTPTERVAKALEAIQRLLETLEAPVARREKQRKAAAFAKAISELREVRAEDLKCGETYIVVPNDLSFATKVLFEDDTDLPIGEGVPRAFLYKSPWTGETIRVPGGRYYALVDDWSGEEFLQRS